MNWTTAFNRYAKRARAAHPDRNAQFEHINRQAKAFQAKGQPVISVDTKKKELIGDFLNKGKEWQRAGEPEPVRVHDFIDPKLGKAIPYGVYDVARNEGWVNVGIDHDTAEFAVESIRRWWYRMGRYAYPRPPNSSHGRRRRQQWLSHPTLETQATEVRGRFGTAADHRALPTWHQQVEQRSSTACFLISPRTGAAAPSRILRPSST